MRAKMLMSLAALAVATAGCSSRPRNFAPVLAAPPADAAAYEAAVAECRDLVLNGANRKSGRLASAAGGAAAGVGAGVAAGAAASGATYGTLGAAAAAASVAIAAVPVFGLAGAWGLSKIKKSKKERVIKAATADCMASAGYKVADWRVMSKKEVRALEAAKATAPSPAAATK